MDQIKDNLDAVEWEMDEYLHHNRGLSWYLVLILCSIACSLLAYLATEQGLLAPIAIMSMAIILIVCTLKKPQRYQYSISETGLQIGGRAYSYDDFKNFSVIEDNGNVALYLITNYRFIPPLTLYLPTEKGRQIVDKLSSYIAYNPANLQLIDRLMSYFRF